MPQLGWGCLAVTVVVAVVSFSGGLRVVGEGGMDGWMYRGDDYLLSTICLQKRLV